MSLIALFIAVGGGIGRAQPMPLIEYNLNDSFGNASVRNTGTAGGPWTWEGHWVNAAPYQDPQDPLARSSVNSPLSYVGRIVPTQPTLSPEHPGFYTSTADARDLDHLKAFTLVMWLRVPSNVRGRLICYHNEEKFAGFDWYLSGQNNAYPLLRVNGQNADAGATLPIAGQQWSFIAVTYDSKVRDGNVHYFLGDSKALQSAGTAQLTAGETGDTGATPLAVFNHSSLMRNTDGLFDNVRIYNSVLSADDLRQVMATNDVPPPGTAQLPFVSAWTDATRDAQKKAADQLNADLNAAIAAGQDYFRIPPGHYRSSGSYAEERPVLLIKNAQNMTIDGTGSTFWQTLGGRQIWLIDCKNVTVRGLRFDCDPICFSQGTIMRIDRNERFIDVQMEPNYGIPEQRPKYWPNVIFYSADGSRMREITFDPAKTVELQPDGLYRIRFNKDMLFTAPNSVVLHDRVVLPWGTNFPAVGVSRCESVTLEDLNIYAASKMAIVEIGSRVGGAGGNVYRRCKVIRRPGTTRLLASVADSFHSIGYAKGPLVEECEFSHAGDDGINIHGFMSLLLKKNSPRQMVIAPPFDRDFDVGSELQFYNYDDLRSIGQAKVTSLTELKDPADIAAVRNLPARIEKEKNCHIDRDFAGKSYLVELDADVPADELAIICSNSYAGRNATVRQSYLHDLWSGVTYNCPDSLFEDNVLERTGGPFKICALVSWFEGPFIQNVTVRNNTFIDCNFSSRIRDFWRCWGVIVTCAFTTDGNIAQLAPYDRMQIENNRIIRPADGGIMIANSRNVTLRGNQIINPFSLNSTGFARKGWPFAVPTSAIYLTHNSGEIVTEHNTVVPLDVQLVQQQPKRD